MKKDRTSSAASNLAGARQAEGSQASSSATATQALPEGLPRINNIEARLAALEKAMTQSREIRATRLVLVDARGRERAALEMEDGDPNLNFWDKRKSCGINLGIVAGDPGLHLSDGASIRAMLALGDEGHPFLHLADTKGQDLINLRVDDDDLPSISLKDAHGETRLNLGLPEGDPMVNLCDAKGEIRLTLDAVIDNGVHRAGIHLNDDSGRLDLTPGTAPVWKAKQTATKHTQPSVDPIAEHLTLRSLAITAPDGSARIQLGTTAGGDPFFTLSDATGKPRFDVKVEGPDVTMSLHDENGMDRLHMTVAEMEEGEDRCSGGYFSWADENNVMTACLGAGGWDLFGNEPFRIHSDAGVLMKGR